MIRRSVKSVLEDPRLSEYYVLVTRYYPRAHSLRKIKLADSPFQAWDRTLAPSRELFDSYKLGLIDEETYRERSLEEVPPATIRRRARIHKANAGNREVVFACIEEDDKFCHTWILLQEAYTRSR